MEWIVVFTVLIAGSEPMIIPDRESAFDSQEACMEVAVVAGGMLARAHPGSTVLVDCQVEVAA